MRRSRSRRGRQNHCHRWFVWAFFIAKLTLFWAGTGAAESNEPAPKRVAVAVLWFENTAADPEAGHWAYFIPRQLVNKMQHIKALKVRSTNALDYAFTKLHIQAGSPVSQDQARQAGEFVEAQRIIWGTYRRDNEQCRVDFRVLSTASGDATAKVTCVADNWLDLPERLFQQILNKLDLVPEKAERIKMNQQETQSAGAFEWHARAFALQETNAPLSEQEHCARQALTADPNYGQAWGALAATLANQGQFSEAERALGRALQIDPNSSPLHAVQGFLFLRQGLWDDGERAMQRALALDPEDTTTLAFLAQLCIQQKRHGEATQYLEKAKLVDPFSAEICATLGFLRVVQRKRAEAMVELQEAERLDPAGRSSNALQMAIQAYASLGEISRAIELCDIILSRMRSAKLNPDALRQFEAMSERLRGSLTPSYVEAIAPKAYTKAELQTALGQRLTEQQLADVINPLRGTEEMKHWAVELTQEANSDRAKAKAIFDGLTRRIKPGGHGGAARTAQEVFRAWKDPNESFNCQEYTKLFIALARHVGLPAFYVHLETDFRGRAVNHDCAGVFIDGKALLVDPTYRWFGAPHKDYIVLNDVQAVAHQHFQSRDVSSCQLASQLHPNFAWGQRRLAAALILAGHEAEGVEILKAAAALEPDHWELNRQLGTIALKHEDAQAATTHLQKALAGNPHDAESHLLLALALANQKALEEARQHARASLRYDPTPDNAKGAWRLIAKLNEQLSD